MPYLRIPLKVMAVVCRELGHAYDAGIPLVQACRLVSQNARQGTVRHVFSDIANRIERGSTLAEAIAAHDAVFPPLFRVVLSAGEKGGHLDKMLYELADYFDSQVELRRTITSMMALPVLQLIAAWYLGTFALGLIRNLHFDARTPFQLRAYVEAYLRFQGVVTLIVAGALFALYWARRLPQLSAWFNGLSSLFLRINPIAKRLALARFFRSMALLTRSGLSIRQCIQQSAATTGFRGMEEDLRRAELGVAKGATLREAFGACKTLTPLDREMISVGETSGKLDEAFRKAAEYHFAAAQHATAIALRVANVLVILCVGAVVGYVVISFYASYFNILNSI